MNNIVSHKYKVTDIKRNTMNGHNSFLIWFTGLSGSGKSTIANAVEQKLYEKGVSTYILDGDNVRSGLNKDLTFAPKCRAENNRRIAEVSKLMIDAGLVVLAAFVSPYKRDRELIKETVSPNNFVEVFINTSIEECEKRDVKGLYKKARVGEIKNMTGVSAPYESPINPDVEVNTEIETIELSVKKVMDFISPKLKLKND